MLRTVIESVLLVGFENSGKSTFVSSVTGHFAESANLFGTTIACERYSDGTRDWIDTPGLITAGDSVAMADTLNELRDADLVVGVLSAEHAREQLPGLLRVIQNKRGILVLTFWDRIQSESTQQELAEQLSSKISVPLLTIDARRMSDHDRQALVHALNSSAAFPAFERVHLELPKVQQRQPGLAKQPLAAALLFLGPPVIAVQAANTFAGLADSWIKGQLAPLVTIIHSWPSLLAAILTGDYGLITMGPLLWVWAFPTVVFFAFLLALYKLTGLLDAGSLALDRYVRPLGLTGRDLARVVMGYGCNVPAVTNSRNCCHSSRSACVSAIAYGAACSYQLPATLAVFGAAGKPWLAFVFLFYLIFTTCAFLWWTSRGRNQTLLPILQQPAGLRVVLPQWTSIAKEVQRTLWQFLTLSLPIFLLISVAASLLSYFGLIHFIADVLGPVMKLFRLPANAATAVVMASIRKDGILLLASPGLATHLDSGQLLAATYLAGVLLPCLVTLLTIARELSWKFATRLLLRQATAASIFAAAIAWLWR